MNQFRDPIHGFIDVTEDENHIIDSKPFQRLRNIKQLATTNLVYHGAEHTRFGHSVGVMHLVSKTFDSVTEKNPKLFSKKAVENEKRCKYYRQILRLIALTHDLGHAPFSHASEELFPSNKKHEDYTKDIIFNTEIGDYINQIGERFQKKYGEQYIITPQLIWAIYNGDFLERDNIAFEVRFFLKGFMDGELDCDKMDYLLRDSKFCGVSYGKYDLERFISTLTVYKDSSSMKLAIEKGGIQALEEFILARYFMFIQVYFHKTRRYFDKQLVKALKVVLPDGHYPENTREFLEWDDNRVMYELKASKHPDVRPFLDRITMTCVYETPAHSGSAAEQDKFQMIYNSLKKECKNILTDNVDKAAHKLQPSYFASKDAKDDSGKAIIILDRKTSKPRDLMEESRILTGIMEPINIQRIYVEKSQVEKAKNLINNMMGK